MAVRDHERSENARTFAILRGRPRRRIGRAPSSAVEAVAELGGAKPGDRTMLDALCPAADSFAAALGAGKSGVEAWKDAVAAARRGAEATASMHPRLGRASYLGARSGQPRRRCGGSRE
jgi:DAK2 domain